MLYLLYCFIWIKWSYDPNKFWIEFSIKICWHTTFTKKIDSSNKNCVKIFKVLRNKSDRNKLLYLSWTWLGQHIGMYKVFGNVFNYFYENRFWFFFKDSQNKTFVAVANLVFSWVGLFWVGVHLPITLLHSLFVDTLSLWNTLFADTIWLDNSN